MNVHAVARVFARFVVGGGSGVAVGFVTFNVLSGSGVVGPVASMVGYAVGGLVNFALQWRLRNFRVD